MHFGSTIAIVANNKYLLNKLYILVRTAKNELENTKHRTVPVRRHNKKLRKYKFVHAINFIGTEIVDLFQVLPPRVDVGGANVQTHRCVANHFTPTKLVTQ